MDISTTQCRRDSPSLFTKNKDSQLNNLQLQLNGDSLLDKFRSNLIQNSVKDGHQKNSKPYCDVLGWKYCKTCRQYIEREDSFERSASEATNYIQENRKDRDSFIGYYSRSSGDLQNTSSSCLKEEENVDRLVSSMFPIIYTSMSKRLQRTNSSSETGVDSSSTQDRFSWRSCSVTSFSSSLTSEVFGYDSQIKKASNDTSDSVPISMNGGLSHSECLCQKPQEDGPESSNGDHMDEISSSESNSLKRVSKFSKRRNKQMGKGYEKVSALESVLIANQTKQVTNNESQSLESASNSVEKKVPQSVEGCQRGPKDLQRTGSHDEEPTHLVEYSSEDNIYDTGASRRIKGCNKTHEHPQGFQSDVFEKQDNSNGAMISMKNSLKSTRTRTPRCSEVWKETGEDRDLGSNEDQISDHSRLTDVCNKNPIGIKKSANPNTKIGDIPEATTDYQHSSLGGSEEAREPQSFKKLKERKLPEKSLQSMARRSSLAGQNIRNIRRASLRSNVEKWQPIFTEELPRSRKKVSTERRFGAKPKFLERNRKEIANRKKASILPKVVASNKRSSQPPDKPILPMEPVKCKLKYIKNRWKDEALFNENDFAILLDIS